MGSYQYRISRVRFDLSDLILAEASRQNVLLEYMRVTKLEVGYCVEFSEKKFFVPDSR